MIWLFWNFSPLATKNTPRVIKYTRKNQPPEQPVDYIVRTVRPKFGLVYGRSRIWSYGPWTVRPRLVRLYSPEIGGGQLGALQKVKRIDIIRTASTIQPR